jgi:steroid 5-alpha reductase family enzyme
MYEVLTILSVNALAVLCYMTIWFLISRRARRLDVVDAAWGGGFIVVALSSFVQRPGVYTALLAIVVMAWGLRLALHIAERNSKTKNDPRYDDLTASWEPRTYWLRAYLSIFLTQGLLILIVGLPLTVGALLQTTGISVFVPLGLLIWAAGFTTEVIADRQLRDFMPTRTPKHSVMNKGLWHYSRHPNYFGEIVVWWGIAMIASSASYGWLGWIGALTITYLIAFVSGIPPLEKRKKNDRAYQEYARHTSVLVPWPHKINGQ